MSIFRVVHAAITASSSLIWFDHFPLHPSMILFLCPKFLIPIISYLCCRCSPSCLVPGSTTLWPRRNGSCRRSLAFPIIYTPVPKAARKISPAGGRRLEHLVMSATLSPPMPLRYYEGRKSYLDRYSWPSSTITSSSHSPSPSKNTIIVGYSPALGGNVDMDNLGRHRYEEVGAEYAAITKRDSVWIQVPSIHSVRSNDQDMSH
jgi:hypothetical protein